jgi:hypothetical protein
MKIAIAVIAALGLTCGCLAQAQAGSLQRDQQRNVVQQARILQGAGSGALTGRETARLELGQARVLHREARAAADGQISAREQAGIRHLENRQGRQISRLKHNGREG